MPASGTSAPEIPADRSLEGRRLLSAHPGRASRRGRLARLEHGLLVSGLALVTLHLLDLALSGPATTVAAVAAIIAVPVAAAFLRPRVSRATRFALAVPLGALCAGTGFAAHVLGLFTSGPRWTDVTGVTFCIGGLLLIAAGCAALTARHAPRPPRTRLGRAARVLAWVAGAVVVGQFAVLPVVSGVITTHAARLPVDGGALDAAHETVRIPSQRGSLAGWYVPSRNGAAVLVIHGAGSNRSKVAAQAEIVAARGYGLLSIDLPGHGESDGHAQLLGGNAQPAIDAALAWLSRRPGVDARRVAGFGMSLGGEVLLEAITRGRRLRAVISDGAERPVDDRDLRIESGLAWFVGSIALQVTRGVSGTMDVPPLVQRLPDAAPKPILLIAAGGRPHEIAVNRAYRDAAGASAELWPIPEAGHTDGVRARPTEYARRVVAFLGRALRPR